VDPVHAEQALQALPERLKLARPAALAALKSFARRPRPAISPAGLREVIDIVWQAEGYTQAKGAPEKYMDLSYKQRALPAQAA
jgi:hypothetical protein